MRKKIMIGMAVLMLAAAGFLFSDNLKVILTYKEFDTQQKELVETYTTYQEPTSSEEKDEQPSVVIPDIGVDFDALQKVNPDIIGWIYIPGTKTNNPILLGEDNNEYLHTNYKKAYQYMGSIFAHYETSPLLDDAYTVLFGHNMRSGRMFGDLSNYSSKSFREQYPYVYLYTPQKNIRFTIFAAGYVDANDPDIYSFGYEYGTEALKNLIDKINRNRLYDPGVLVSEDRQILCLSTCTAGRAKTERFVVHCVAESV